MTNRKILRSQNVGKPEEFALEWGLSEAFTRPGDWAIGYFTICIKGRYFGVKAPDATMLAVSYDGMWKRVKGRGSHIAPFSLRPAAEVAHAVRSALYNKTSPSDRFVDLSLEEFKGYVYRRPDILWAPDGEEGFDDGSHVLQFDIGNQVRLIGFVNMAEISEALSTVTEVTIESETFYTVLQSWIDSIIKARDDLLDGN